MKNQETKKVGFYLRTAESSSSFTKGQLYKTVPFGNLISNDGLLVEFDKDDFSDKIAVHIPTQGDWDYVASKLCYKDNFWSIYVTETCISLNVSKCGPRYYYQDNNFHIITMDQFRALFKDEAPKHEKVCIRGHVTRGSDVLSKLESLGGVNPWKWECDKEDIFYSIGPDSIINSEKVIPDGYTEILLEEPIFYSRYLNNLCSTDSDGNLVPNVLFSPRAKVIFPSPMMAEANKKVVIRGHKTRGSEVRAKLESLGGINNSRYSCSYHYFYYFILEDNSISRCDINDKPKGYTEIFLDEPSTAKDTKLKARLGRKQDRVILDDNNFAHEICSFTEKYKHLAPSVVDFLNNLSSSDSIDGSKKEPQITKEQVELKVVEYAKSVNGKVQNILDKYNPKVETKEQFNLSPEGSFPRVMLVRSLGSNEWYQRVVVGFKNGYYLTWNTAETMEQAEKSLHITPWKEAKDLPEEVTMDQVAAALGKELGTFKVID